MCAAPSFRNVKPVSSPKYSLEFWADSFHEGNWACESLKEHLKFESVEFLQGFIPRSRFRVSDGELLEITVLGSYKSWTLVPQKIKDLLDWGKPDLVIYDPVREVIVAAAEETAAVPTGNQALQRCERIYGSARNGIPFWYLLPEYGLHIDQGERRDSIWPTIFALKLTLYYGIPSVVLHYAEHGKPEAYDAGTGMRRLFESLAFQLEIYLGFHKPSDFLPNLTEQYGTMLAFVKSQWPEMTRFLPGEELLENPLTAQRLAARAIGGEIPKALGSFLVWKNLDEVPDYVREITRPQSLIKADPFLSRVEQQVGVSCYTLSNNTGSRPQPPREVAACIEQQSRMARSYGTLRPAAVFSLRLDDFPKSPGGGRHLTTAKNVIYLFDSWKSLFDCLVYAYPRLGALRAKVPANRPALLYVSNSIKPGRIFGDPFTGQLAAYSFVFGKDASAPRTVVAYYPHQVYTQLFNANGFNKNKGITLMRDAADYAIFHGGVAVNMKTGEVI